MQMSALNDKVLQIQATITDDKKSAKQPSSSASADSSCKAWKAPLPTAQPEATKSEGMLGTTVPEHKTGASSAGTSAKEHPGAKGKQPSVTQRETKGETKGKKEITDLDRDLRLSGALLNRVVAAHGFTGTAWTTAWAQLLPELRDMSHDLTAHRMAAKNPADIAQLESTIDVLLQVQSLAKGKGKGKDEGKDTGKNKGETKGNFWRWS